MAPDQHDPVGAHGLSIQRASERLGVPAPTLRSWERRYGLPTTGRSPGGHRRYGDEALRQLVLMRDLISQGRRAAEAAVSARDLVDESDPARRRVKNFLAASRALDPAAVRAELDSARRELGLGAALDDVVMPAMRQLGSLWSAGRCDIGQEHLTSEAVRGWLSRITALAPAPRDQGLVVLACGPRDLHTLGLEGLGALLAERRVGLRLLGARTPARSLVNAVVAIEATAVVVVSHLPSARRPAVESLRDVAATGCSVFYGGNAFVNAEARAGVSGAFLGNGLTAAADLLVDYLA